MKNKDSASIERTDDGLYRVVWVTEYDFDDITEEAEWYGPTASTRAEAKQEALQHLYTLRQRVADRDFSVPEGDTLSTSLEVSLGTMAFLTKPIARLVGERNEAIANAVLEGIDSIDELISLTNSL